MIQRLVRLSKPSLVLHLTQSVRCSSVWDIVCWTEVLGINCTTQAKHKLVGNFQLLLRRLVCRLLLNVLFAMFLGAIILLHHSIEDLSYHLLRRVVTRLDVFYTNSIAITCFTFLVAIKAACTYFCKLWYFIFSLHHCCFVLLRLILFPICEGHATLLYIVLLHINCCRILLRRWQYLFLMWLFRLFRFSPLEWPFFFIFLQILCKIWPWCLLVF